MSGPGSARANLAVARPGGWGTKMPFTYDRPWSRPSRCDFCLRVFPSGHGPEAGPWAECAQVHQPGLKMECKGERVPDETSSAVGIFSLYIRGRQRYLAPPAPVF